MKHFDLTGKGNTAGGLSPSALLRAIENGEDVTPVEETTNLRYVGPESMAGETVVEDDAVEENPPETSADEIAPESVLPTPVNELIPAGNVTVESAAQIIYQCLPVPVQRMATDMMVNMRLTLPQFLLGIINASYDRGNFSQPILDPAWSTPGASFLVQDATCENPACGKRFTPKYRGQRYCCRECGLAGEETAVTRRRLEERRRMEARVDEVDDE